MTTITIDRAVIAQALEALMDSQPLVQHAYDTDWRKGMPTRQAQRDSMAKDLQNHNESITALCAALVAPQPEPVAWIDGPHGALRHNPLHKIVAPKSIAWSLPLYVAPPQREPLTDDQLFDIATKNFGDDDLSSLIEMGRMVEAAHGIGGKP